MNPIKGIASIVGLGTFATAVGLGAHSLSSSGDSTVEGKLRGERSRFLNFDYEKDEEVGKDERAGGGASSYSYWLAVISGYGDEESDKKFKDLNFTYNNEDNGYNSSNQDTIRKFKKKCKELLTSEGSLENLGLFERWCIKPADL